MASTQVEFPSENPLGSCPGFVSKPLSGTPTTMGVIILQEWWGVNEQIKNKGIKIANDLNATTIVPDLYRGKVAIDREQAGHLMTGLNWSGAIQDILGSAKYLRNEMGCKKVGVVGFCMGGALTLAAASTQDGSESSLINAASCFYGIPQMDVSKIKIPVIAHFGELDDAIGFSDIESAKKLQNSWTENGVNGKVYLYPGVGHAFTNDKRPEAYNEEACTLALQRTCDFFRQYLQ
ncbi:hypothetical protein C9374_007353 [Naegleria lovaniensis]|uniref:Dienelactone hydrolase domain-containing protein n=1 Tax=Naegleria lovaniensis TaxID=51637 RepID=A0AA88KLR9_NAELO|nr:uncharacterized protein C9374_007353 [Naegleria lovaniensis]KAG2379214.1 hypothetical protein C9374_007353 [Naegleria lovaniensis]